MQRSSPQSPTESWQTFVYTCVHLCMQEGKAGVLISPETENNFQILLMSVKLKFHFYFSFRTERLYKPLFSIVSWLVLDSEQVKETSFMPSETERQLSIFQGDGREKGGWNVWRNQKDGCKKEHICKALRIIHFRKAWKWWTRPIMTYCRKQACLKTQYLQDTHQETMLCR